MPVAHERPPQQRHRDPLHGGRTHLPEPPAPLQLRGDMREALPEDQLLPEAPGEELPEHGGAGARAVRVTRHQADEDRLLAGRLLL